MTETTKAVDVKERQIVGLGLALLFLILFGSCVGSLVSMGAGLLAPYWVMPHLFHKEASDNVAIPTGLAFVALFLFCFYRYCQRKLAKMEGK